MTFMDEGIQKGLQFYIRAGVGSANTFPNYVFFGENNTLGSNIIGDETLGSNFIDADYLHKLVTWSASATTSLCEANMNTVECVGSIITHVGLVNGNTLGSGVLFSLQHTAIGSKNETFEVQLTGEVIITRP